MLQNSFHSFFVTFKMTLTFKCRRCVTLIEYGDLVNFTVWMLVDCFAVVQ